MDHVIESETGVSGPQDSAQSVDITERATDWWAASYYPWGERGWIKCRCGADFHSRDGLMATDAHAEHWQKKHTKPEYVYVASSWRNPIQPAFMEILKAAKIEAYDFRNPPEGTAFSWSQVGGQAFSESEPRETYLELIEDSIAVAGYNADFAAMQRADTFVLLLPCGRSAHLELGWAVGQGKRTAILLDDPCTPELMYRMVDYLATSVVDLLGWLKVED